MSNADHAPSVTTLQYNSDGLPSLVQDPMGHQEMVTYNAQSAGSGNLVITVTHVADSSVRSLTLDPMGRIIKAVDENGVITASPRSLPPRPRRR